MVVLDRCRSLVVVLATVTIEFDFIVLNLALLPRKGHP